MEVAVIGALDGNQSLKRRKLRDGLEDEPRTFSSSYFIPEDEVNHFQYDVKTRAPRKEVLHLL